MAITTYQAWVTAGKKAQPSQPVVDLIATLTAHGVSATWYPDDRHLKASPPEDHTPYSHTPWPGSQPYPYVLAMDIVGDGWARIGQQLVADKAAGVAGTECIKYINWTDSFSRCWEDSWTPGHRRVVSTDRGHTHVSFRTDYAHSDVMASYSPFPTPPLEGDDLKPLLLRLAGSPSPDAPVSLQPGAMWVTDLVWRRWVPWKTAENNLMGRLGITEAQVIPTLATDLPAWGVDADQHATGPALDHTHSIPVAQTGTAVPAQ